LTIANLGVINSLAYGSDANGNPRLYAGDNNGRLWSCDPSQGSCFTLDRDQVAPPPGYSYPYPSIVSLQFANGLLYSGACLLHSNCGEPDLGVWICDPSTPNNCATNVPPPLGVTPPLARQPTLRTSGSASTSAQGNTVLVDPGIRLSCPARAGRCSATETTTSGTSAAANATRVQIGSARFSTAAGKRRELRFKLNPSGVRLLRKLGRLRASVTVVSWARHDKKLTTIKTITIKQPRRKRKHG
jgi:hypothetical protein